MLKYAISKTALKNEIEKCTATVYGMKSLSEKEIIEKIKKHECSLTIAELTSAISLYNQVILESLREGYFLNLSILKASYSIKGIFDGKDSFLEDRKRLRLNISKGIALRKFIKEEREKLELEKIVAPEPRLKIIEVRDNISGAVIDKIVPGSLIDVSGHKFKIAGNNKECGLWFVAQDGTKTKTTYLIRNKPSLIIAEVPDLAPGEYRMKVVTQATSRKKILLQEPKTFEYQPVLNVK